MVKLAYIFLQKSDLLWVKVMQAKYFRDTPNGLALRKWAPKSALWRGILRAWETMTIGSRSGIRGGQNTAFWTGRWLDSGDLLINHSLVPTEQLDLDAPVCRFVNDLGEWDLDRIRLVLPDEVVQQITGILPPSADKGEDSWYWGEEPNGMFSIRSAYCLILQSDRQPLAVDWKKVWRWVGPSRVQHFLWLAMHNKLMTNLERTRRHLTSNSLCPRCSNHDESVSHVLRDCRFASEVWAALQFQVTRPDSGVFSEWLAAGMEHQEGMLFGIGCWYLWKARNERVFSANFQSPAVVAARISSWKKTVDNAINLEMGLGPQNISRTITEVEWDPGPEDWITLNTDGSVLQPSGIATIGGLIRNHLGFCSLAFSGKLGICSITRAELRAILQGLDYAWNGGHRKVLVQTDSLAAVLLLRAAESPTHCHLSKVSSIRERLERDWQVDIRHIYREANGAADYLANLGHNFDLGTHLVPSSDCNLGYFLRKDCMRIAEFRSIPIIN
ncbi:Putative ribonuclease H protein At1g65750 [Linum perenne]